MYGNATNEKRQSSNVLRVGATTAVSPDPTAAATPDRVAAGLRGGSGCYVLVRAGTEWAMTTMTARRCLYTARRPGRVTPTCQLWHRVRLHTAHEPRGSAALSGPIRFHAMHPCPSAESPHLFPRRARLTAAMVLDCSWRASKLESRAMPLVSSRLSSPLVPRSVLSLWLSPLPPLSRCCPAIHKATGQRALDASGEG